MIRKNFGVAGAGHFAPNNYVLAWPSVESGALPIEGGVAVAFRREIEAAADPDAKRKELEEMLASQQNPFARGESLGVHELIDPAETRVFLCDWAESVQALLPPLLGPVAFPYRGT
jgi:methylmalonyl-CoA decarboxylase subunit alpha